MVGGVLALTDSGLLLSTARSPFGGDTDQGGVNTAALGNTAVLTVEPRIVVAGEGPRAAEPFQFSLRVVPSNYEIQSAQVEYRVFDVTVAETPVTLVDGRGELTFPLGFEFPRIVSNIARPRLILNEGTDTELASVPKPLELSFFDLDYVWAEKEVEPDSGVEPNDETLTADFPELPVEAISTEWFRRSVEGLEDETTALRFISWESQPSPATTRHQKGLEKEGFYETVLEPGAVAGFESFVTAKIEDVVLGRTEPVPIEPGEAKQLILVADRTVYPGDDKTEVELTVEARDQHGNLVSDGTVVLWEKPGAHEGSFVQKRETTTNGRATARYRAGAIRPHSPRIKVHVDDAEKEIQLEQVFVDIKVRTPSEVVFANGEYAGPVEFEAEVTSSAGPPADGAPVTWSATLGRIEEVEPLRNGIAKARWVPVEGLPFRGAIGVLANLGTARDDAVMMVATGSATTATATAASIPIATVEPMVIAGDQTADGFASFETLEGNIELVPFKATAEYRVTGLLPGEHVTVRLGSNQNPNIEPVAHYAAEEELFEDTVVDSAGSHDGLATGGVGLQSQGYRGMGFLHDGTGTITIPHDPAFDFVGPFSVQAAVKPASSAGTQRIIDKPEAFRLELVEIDTSVRARFTVTTALGEASVTSLVPVPISTWTLVTGRFESGRLWVGVGEDEESLFLSEGPIHSTTNIEIGPSFRGGVDEVRFFDLTRPFLSVFAGGEQNVSFEADASGEYRTQILSTGVYGDFGGGDFAASATAAADDNPSVSDSTLRPFFTEIVTVFEDQGLEAKGWVGIIGFAMLTAFFKFAEGIWAGTGNDLDPTIIAGDVIGTIWLMPVSIVREAINAGERAVQMQADGTDAAILALFVIQVAAIVAKKKAGLVLKLGRLGRLLRLGGTANGTMARIMVQQAERTVLGIGDIQRVRKIAELATAGLIVAQAIAGLIQGLADQEESVDHIEAILANAEDPEDVAAAIAELQSSVNDTDEFRLLVAALGEPVEEEDLTAPAGALSFQTPGATAVLRAIVVGRGMTRGIETVRRLVRETSGALRARTVSARITRYFRTDSPAVFAGLQALDDIGSVNISRLARALGSRARFVREGSRFVLQALLRSARTGQKVEIEKFARLSVGGVKRPLRRFYDFVIDGVRYECKRWRFTPPASNFFQARAVNAANEQWLRDLADVARTSGPGGIATQLRWLFPKALDPNKLRDHFMNVLKDPRLRSKFTRYLDPQNTSITVQQVEDVLRKNIHLVIDVL